MPAISAHRYPAPLHPLHLILLAGILPLFLGVLFSDLAYASSYEVQWKNLSSWLLVGGLVFGGFTLLWALVATLGADQRNRRSAVYLVVLLAMWVLGFINALVHAKDAWASMPEALVLSAIVAALAIAGTVLGFSTVRAREWK